jgi:hypothetical protein
MKKYPMPCPDCCRVVISGGIRCPLCWKKMNPKYLDLQAEEIIQKLKERDAERRASQLDYDFVEYDDIDDEEDLLNEGPMLKEDTMETPVIRPDVPDEDEPDEHEFSSIEEYNLYHEDRMNRRQINMDEDYEFE